MIPLYFCNLPIANRDLIPMIFLRGRGGGVESALAGERHVATVIKKVFRLHSDLKEVKHRYIKRSRKWDFITISKMAVVFIMKCLF